MKRLIFDKSILNNLLRRFFLISILVFAPLLGFVNTTLSPEHLVKEYVNQLVRGETEILFSRFFPYRFAEASRIRIQFPKTQWEQYAKLMYDQIKEGLQDSIGIVKRGMMDPYCWVFYGVPGETPGDEIREDSRCYNAYDFLYEKPGTLRASVQEVRPGPLLRLNMGDLGVLENVPSWNAFIKVEYLDRSAAPVLMGEKIKVAMLKMNVIEITPINDVNKIGVDLLGLSGFLLDGVTELVEYVDWE